MKNCDLDVGDSVRVDGPCVVYYSKRKSAKRITLSIAADRSVKISPTSQSSPHILEEHLSASNNGVDVVNV